MASTSAAAIIARHLRRGDRIAYGDGAGSPLSLGIPLAEAATEVGEVSLLLGWSLELSIPIDREVFTDVATVIGGYALRRPLREGRVRYLPVRLSTLPALLNGPLKVDHIVAGVRPARGGGHVFGSEVGWMRAAVDAGATVLAEVNHALPDATDGVVLPADRVVVVSEVRRPPIARRGVRSSLEAEKIGRLVADLIPEAASVQFGPGLVGEVVLASLQVPVHIHSGVLTDAVVDLDERGLLLTDPVSTYLAGSELLYRWADGRRILAPVEQTHDVSRLSQLPLYAVNTALEIDRTGQVNVEGIGGDVIAGVGGHPDFAAGASQSPTGLSVVALPTLRGSQPTLVDNLSAPTSTTRSDVDVVVTERGVADLRTLDDRQRADALKGLWNA